jgi:hypothetical protein
MNIWCAHLNHGPTLEGRAICGDCGAVVRTQLTRELMDETVEMIKRDHGMFGRHSMACVESDLGWCCADDCSFPANARLLRQ